MYSLEKFLAYKNPRLLSRYETDYPNAKLTAREALAELMKYIWLCHVHRDEKNINPNKEDLNFTCVVHHEMLDIDYMWHTFLLFTRDYHSFCEHYLEGKFFHHEPIDKDDRKESVEAYTTELNRYLSFIYDKLGEETLVKWFGVDL